MSTICGGIDKVNDNPGPLVAAYCALMFCRNKELSAFQHMTTLLAIDGRATDVVGAIMHYFFILLSNTL
jgi:hypothetical protein